LQFNVLQVLEGEIAQRSEAAAQLRGIQRQLAAAERAALASESATCKMHDLLQQKTQLQERIKNCSAQIKVWEPVPLCKGTVVRIPWVLQCAPS